MSNPDPAPRAERLLLAFDAGLTLPEQGALVVLHPGAGEGLASLPAARVQIVTPHATATDWFTAQGFDCRIAPEGPAAWAMVCLPRSREESRDLLAQLCAGLAPGTPVVIDGQKTDGIEAMLRDIRARLDVQGPISKGHGKIFWFPAPEPAVFADWIAPPREIESPEGIRLHTMPGLFSADGVDPGSALLADHLPQGLSGRVVDLGAGWGYLAAVIAAKSAGVRELHLIESDARALDCAKQNLSDPRARFHWADATRPLPGIVADWVVTNPPFHQGRHATPALGAAFIASAARMLTAQGRMLLVANRHLPYETALATHFGRCSTLESTSAYKLILAEAPRSAQPGTARRRQRQGR